MINVENPTPFGWLMTVGSVAAVFLSLLSLWAQFAKKERKDGADDLIQQQHTIDIDALKKTTASHEITLHHHAKLFEAQEKDAGRKDAKLDEMSGALNRILGKLN